MNIKSKTVFNNLQVFTTTAKKSITTATHTKLATGN